MQPRDVMIQWLYKNIPDLIIQPEDRSEFDIVGEVNGNGSKSIYSVDVHERWVEKWPENWRYIYIPLKNKKLIDDWKNFNRYDLYTFIIFRKDLKKAWHISSDVVNDSKILGQNYLIDIRDAYQVEMIND